MHAALEDPARDAAVDAAVTAPPLAPPAAHGAGRRWSDAPGKVVQGDPDQPWSMAQQWPQLVATLSEQAVESSNLLLRALNYLVGAGRLRRAEAKALGEAMHQLRATSLRAQQITRLAGGRIRQSRERVDLAALVRQVLEDRHGEITAAGAVVGCNLEPIDVLLDPPVATSLLHAILDWGLSFSKELRLTLVPPAGPGPAQLKVRVATPPPSAAVHGQGMGWTVRPRGRRLNDGLHWMLLRQLAASSGLEVRRTREEGACLLSIGFPDTFHDTDGLACLELGAGERAAPLRDAWVLVVVRDEQLRAEATEALRRTGMAVRCAASVAEARMAIGEGCPGVLVTAWDIPQEDIVQLRAHLPADAEHCPQVEITRELPSFQLHGFDRFETPKVGRAQVEKDLAPTVLFELVKLA